MRPNNFYSNSTYSHGELCTAHCVKLFPFSNRNKALNEYATEPLCTDILEERCEAYKHKTMGTIINIYKNLQITYSVLALTAADILNIAKNQDYFTFNNAKDFPRFTFMIDYRKLYSIFWFDI